MRTVVSLAVTVREDEEEDKEEEEEPPQVWNPRKDKMHRFIKTAVRDKKNKRKTKVCNFFPYLGRNRFTRDRVR